MGRRIRLLTAIAIGALAAFGGTAVAQQATPPGMIVRAYNYAAVPSETLWLAREKAVRAFDDIGVHVVWIDVTGDLAHPVETSDPPTSFTVRLLIRPRRIGPSTMPDLELGRALAASNSVGNVMVFYEQIMGVASTYRVRIESVLALAIAHEIGHTLLPYPSHTPTGIMRAFWHDEEIRLALVGPLAFSAPQGALIRAKVGGCCSP